MVSRIPDSLSCISADSTSKNLSDSAIRIPLNVVKSFTVTLHPLFTSESVELKAKCGAVVDLIMKVISHRSGRPLDWNTVL